MKRLDSFGTRLRRIADLLETDTFCRNLLKPELLKVHRVVRDDSNPAMARLIADLPNTLRCYARLLIHAVSLRWAFSRRRRTLPERQAVMSRILFDEVRRITGRDRIDTVLPLLNIASKHFNLGKRFEKKALSAQLKRLRSR